MILRPNILTTLDSVPCTANVDFIDLTNLRYKLTVDGTVIFDTNNLVAFVFPASVVTVANGIVVDGMGQDNTGAYFRINLANIWDRTSVKLEISKTGYYSYNEVFEVYGYDLGDPEIPLGHNNTPFEIYLIPNNDNINGEQTIAFAHLISYRKPFTDEVYFYNGSSSGQDKIYTYSSGIQNGSNGFVCPGVVTITQTNNIYNNVGMTRTLVSSCFKTISIGVNPVVDVPFNTEITCNNCDTECEDCADCTTTTEQVNTATTFANYNLLDTYWRNDIEVYPFVNQRIVYNLYDYAGNLIQTLTYNYTIAVPFVFDFTLYRLNDFNIPIVGDYILEVTLSIPDFKECVKTYPIINCNWYEIEQIECNEFKVHNRSFEEITLIINKLNDDNEFELVSTTDIDLLDFLDVTLDTDGIYQFQVTRDDVTYTFIVIVYCNLKACLLDRLQHLICANENNLCRDKDYYDFNALVLNAHTYFAMLNNEYNFNYIYTALTQTKLDELYQINDFITRFEEYCLDCDPACEECAQANLNCKDCG